MGIEKTDAESTDIYQDGLLVEGYTLKLDNDKDRKCAIDFITFLEPPSPEFDEHAFFTKGVLLLEEEIKEFLQTQNRKTTGSFCHLTILASKIHQNKWLWHAVHNLRLIRNKYAHSLKDYDEKDALIDTFIEHAEKSISFDGESWFKLIDKKNERALRLYYLVVSVWEYLCCLNGASDSFTPASIWLESDKNAINNLPVLKEKTIGTGSDKAV